ncbi:MAG TPA: hypothetical protein VEN82_06195 [Actinomycetota bacterium]|nr:hypothetical protein [Actinomycetota bacterium]
MTFRRRMLILVPFMALGLLVSMAMAPAIASPQRVAGDYTLDFQWDGYPPGSTGLHLSADHSFTTDDGGAGTWSYSKSTKTLKMQYTVGCLPLYTGHKTRAGFAGTQACTDGSGGTGRWHATKGAAPRHPSSHHGVSSAGRA